MELVKVSKVTRLLHPKLTAIITSCNREGKCNAMSAAWVMPVSANPPLIVVAISPKRLTYTYIKETREFGVNIPLINMLEIVNYFGSVSGRVENKLSKVKTFKAKKINVPLITGCVAWLECIVENEVEAGDHVLFIGRVLDAYALKDYIDEDGTYNVYKFKPVLHLGGDKYTTIENVKYVP